MEFGHHDRGPFEDRVLAFDTLFTNNQIQKFKIMIPFLDNQMQKKMAIYIKYRELQYTISYFRRYPYRLCGCFEQESPGNFTGLCHSLMCYADEKEKRQMEQFMSLFRAMEMYQEFSQTMEMMKDFMPDIQPFGEGGCGEETDGGHGGDMMSVLLGMLTPEQQKMFEMFGGNDIE